MKKIKVNATEAHAKIRVAALKAAMHLTVFTGFFAAMGFYSLASTDYGEKAGGWILEQLFWVGLVVLAYGLIKCLVAKAWVQAIIVTVCGGVILFLIKQPDILENVGSALWNNVMGG